MALLFLLLAQDFSVIDSGTRKDGPKDDPKYERIVDAAAFKALWDSLPSSQKPKEMPKVDFSAKMVIAIVLSKEADRKLLKVESLKEAKGTLTLTFSLTPLAVDGGPGLRLPYLIIEVPRSTSPLQLIELLKKTPAGDAVQVKPVKQFEALK